MMKTSKELFRFRQFGKHVKTCKSTFLHYSFRIISKFSIEISSSERKELEYTLDDNVFSLQLVDFYNIAQLINIINNCQT